MIAYIVQERARKGSGWYDDPNCRKNRTFQNAAKELRNDTETPGHMKVYQHRIILRVETVLTRTHSK